MMKNITLLLASTVSALACTSCLKANAPECHVSVAANITAVTGPRQATVNQALTYDITYPLLNSCGKYNGTDEQVNGNTRTINVLTYYDGCSCQATVTTNHQAYTFQPTQAGTYYLRFSRDSGYLVDTLVVK